MTRALNSRRNKGFTLLELMLSMAIVAMLTLALYSAFYAAFKARDSAQAQVVGVRAATVALDLIEEDLKSVQPPTPTFGGGTTDGGSSTTPTGNGPFNGPFVGSASGTSGAANSAEIDCYAMGHDFGRPDSLFAESMRHIQLMVIQDGASTDLVRNVNRNLLSPNGEVMTQEILAKNVTSFTVQYYDGTSWNDSWDTTQTDMTQTNTLPVAVDITIEVQDPNSKDKKTYKTSRMIALPCGVSTANSSSSTTGGTQ